jgi:hypothetical protein
MIVVGHLATAFGLSLLLILAVEAVRAGRGLYWPAVIGLGAAILGWLGDGYMLPVLVFILRWGGLAAAALVLVIDLLTEEIPIDEAPPPPADLGEPGSI